MEPERVRELMCENFGSVWSDEHEWVNVHDGKHARVELLASLIAMNFDGEDVLIQVDYEHAARVSRFDAAGYIAPLVLTADIQIANIAFTQFFFVSSNSVAAGWKRMHSESRGDGA
jgi:hypothetical protein